VETAAGGIFAITGLRDDDYKIGVQIPNVEFWYPGVSIWDSAGVVTITDHQVIEDIVVRRPD
jgi:hypothetical protein